MKPDSPLFQHSSIRSMNIGGAYDVVSPFDYRRIGSQIWMQTIPVVRGVQVYENLHITTSWHHTASSLPQFSSDSLTDDRDFVCNGCDAISIWTILLPHRQGIYECLMGSECASFCEVVFLFLQDESSVQPEGRVEIAQCDHKRLCIGLPLPIVKIRRDEFLFVESYFLPGNEEVWVQVTSIHFDISFALNPAKIHYTDSIVKACKEISFGSGVPSNLAGRKNFQFKGI